MNRLADPYKFQAKNSLTEQNEEQNYKLTHCTTNKNKKNH